jgi:hypothetical protein
VTTTSELAVRTPETVYSVGEAGAILRDADSRNALCLDAAANSTRLKTRANTGERECRDETLADIEHEEPWQ